MPALTLIGNALLLISLISLALGLYRKTISLTPIVCLWSAIVLLELALAFDRFELVYVYSYSATALPLWLKLASLWGGEQGTLLLLSTLLATLGWHYRAWPSTRVGMQLIALAMLLGCLWFNPFAATGTMANEGLGLNAHLVSPWMALHPPAVLLAYSFLWLPVGAAIHGLNGANSAAWLVAVRGAASVGWGLMCLGLASGMWWAFQDFTYGQFWHWDPVQTAVFTVWALASGQLHGIRQLNPQKPAPALLLWSSVLCAISIPLALLIVRDSTLASSHRYIGDTSLWLMLILAAGQLLAALWARFSRQQRTIASRQAVILIIACWMFFAMAAGAAGSLAYSYICENLHCSRDFVPFRQAVLSWTGGAEYAHLAKVFDQWEVDHFVVVRLLLPLMAVLLLMTGYAFIRTSTKRALSLTVIAGITGLAVGLYFKPLENLIDGTGVTTAHTMQLFSVLDVLLMWCLWAILATLLWCYQAWRRRGWNAWSRLIPVGLVHLGAILFIVGATIASTLDSSLQKTFSLPAQYGKQIRLGSEFTVTLDAPQWIQSHDGIAGGSALSALSRWQFSTSDGLAQQEHASILYRDTRAQQDGTQMGSFRQRCMILDYRFARALDRPGYMLHPVINRGLLADWQIWMPAEPPPLQGESREQLMIARRFPMMSLLWSGLVLILVGTSLILLSGLRRTVYPVTSQ
ncbi:cytochrome c biogenesis protein CcsA [Granulosicoccus antarcticus]|nr:cytochrome c biogenesis protein CcsA [Granulosicoccus antarcticus]